MSQIGSLRSILQSIIRNKPSFRESKTPGLSLAIELWTVSTQVEHKNGVIKTIDTDFRNKCWTTESKVSRLSLKSLNGLNRINKN